MSKMCRMCGYEAEDRNKFCPGCGSPLTDSPQNGATPTFVENERSSSPIYMPTGGQSSGAGQDNNGYSASYDPNTVTPDKLVLQPAVAVLLSVLVLFGLGQMINGQIGKGFLLLGLQLLLGFVTCGISVIPGYVVIGIDAYMCAKALQEGKTIGKWSFFGS